MVKTGSQDMLLNPEQFCHVIVACELFSLIQHSQFTSVLVPTHGKSAVYLAGHIADPSPAVLYVTVGL